jgi:hypothetical protein
MRIRNLVAVAVLLTAPVSVLATETRAQLADLQALKNRQDWNELLAHLKDIPASQRGHEWNELARAVCLRPFDNADWRESWKIDECMQTLTSVMNAEPSDNDFAIKAGKWAVSVRSFSDAVPFFAHAVQTAGDPACKDPAIIAAASAGLALSPGERRNLPIIQQSQKLAFTICWPATRDEVFRRFDNIGTDQYLLNVCDLLKSNEALQPNRQMVCEREADHALSKHHVPETPLDGSTWVIVALPDKASADSGAKNVLQKLEITNGWIGIWKKAGFSSAPLQYHGDARSGSWTARQWDGVKEKAKWSGRVQTTNAMQGSLVITKSDGTKWFYSFDAHKEEN